MTDNCQLSFYVYISQNVLPTVYIFKIACTQKHFITILNTESDVVRYANTLNW